MKWFNILVDNSTVTDDDERCDKKIKQCETHGLVLKLMCCSDLGWIETWSFVYLNVLQPRSANK